MIEMFEMNLLSLHSTDVLLALIPLDNTTEKNHHSMKSAFTSK